MREYAQKQAATRAGIDERSFRLLVDRRIILATPSTRTLGRGKSKMYSEDEVLIAALLSGLVKLNASTFTLAGASDFFRSHLRGEYFNAARRDKPIYIRLGYRGGDEWNTEIGYYYEDRYINGLSFTHSEDGGLETDFYVINLNSKIRNVSIDFIELHKKGSSPSDVVEAFDKGGMGEFLEKYHSPEEVSELIIMARLSVDNNDTWLVD